MGTGSLLSVPWSFWARYISARMARVVWWTSASMFMVSLAQVGFISGFVARRCTGADQGTIAAGIRRQPDFAALPYSSHKCVRSPMHFSTSIGSLFFTPLSDAARRNERPGGIKGCRPNGAGPRSRAGLNACDMVWDHSAPQSRSKRTLNAFRAICGHDAPSLQYEQELIILESEVLLRRVRAVRLAIIEGARENVLVSNGFPGLPVDKQ
jgi:hypothetical protein